MALSTLATLIAHTWSQRTSARLRIMPQAGPVHHRRLRRQQALPLHLGLSRPQVLLRRTVPRRLVHLVLLSLSLLLSARSWPFELFDMMYFGHCVVVYQTFVVHWIDFLIFWTFGFMDLVRNFWSSYALLPFCQVLWYLFYKTSAGGENLGQFGSRWMQCIQVWHLNQILIKRTLISLDIMAHIIFRSWISLAVNFGKLKIKYSINLISLGLGLLRESDISFTLPRALRRFLVRLFWDDVSFNVSLTCSSSVSHNNIKKLNRRFTRSKGLEKITGDGGEAKCIIQNDGWIKISN